MSPYVSSFRRTSWLFATVLFVSIGGCGGYSPEAHRVDPALARKTLEEVLASWQQGATPESWQEKTPQVVVQDMEWKSGTKLKSFEIVGDGKAIDANLNCRVKLTFADGDDGERERTVLYYVGTSPVLTVFRAPGP